MNWKRIQCMHIHSSIILAHHATCVSVEDASFANNGNNEFFSKFSFLFCFWEREIVGNTFFPTKTEYIQPGLNLVVKRTTGSHAILLTWSLSQLPAEDFRYTLYFRSSSSPDKDWKHVKNAVDITSQEFLWPGSPCVGVVCQFRVFGKMATGRTTSGEFILRAFTSDVSSMATSTGHLLEKYFIASPPIPQSTASDVAAIASEATSIRIPAESSKSVSAPDLASSVREKLISSYELSSDVVTLDAYGELSILEVLGDVARSVLKSIKKS